MTEEQTWGEPDVEVLNEDLANSYSGFAESWQPQPGDGNKIRVCPPKAGAKFYLRVDLHYSIGPKNRTFPCPRSVDEDESCFLCDLAEQLRDSDDPARQAEYQQVRAKKRYLIAIVDVNAKDKGIQVWRAPTTCWRDIVMIIRDPDWGNITHPQTGRNIKIIKTGSKMNTDYTVQVLPNATKFPLEMSTLADLPDLLDTVTFADDQEMEVAYYDEGTDDDGEYEGDDPEDVPPEGVPVDGDAGELYQPDEPAEDDGDGDGEPAEDDGDGDGEPAEPVEDVSPVADMRPRRPAPVRRTATAAEPVARITRAPTGTPLKPQTAKATKAAAPSSRRAAPARRSATSSTRAAVRQAATAARKR